MAEPPTPSVIWMRPSRGSRGPQPSRDRDAIARTAIAIADREGIAAVSMRRIAAEIGSGTSSLYRYFARKDDLLNLMVDGVLAADLPASSGDWRTDLLAFAEGMRLVFVEHPWLATALAGRPTLGPNRLRSLEHVLDMLQRAGLEPAASFVLIDTLTSYVRGFVASTIADAAMIAETGLTAEAWQAEQAAYIEAVSMSGAYPLSTELFRQLGEGGAAAAQDQGFTDGLGILLDGIAVRLKGETAGTAKRRA